jgi:hypothetical protein
MADRVLQAELRRTDRLGRGGHAKYRRHRDRPVETAGVPMFRTQSRYTAYIEGWGLYAESLAKEMGGYEDPYSDFGRLGAEVWRAIRLVVDTGLHASEC